MNEGMPSDYILDRYCELWGLSSLTFVRKMENIVYSAECRGKRAYLRLTTPLRRKKAEIEAELNWIAHLAKSGLNVPEIIADKRGHRINTLSHNQEHFEA